MTTLQPFSPEYQKMWPQSLQDWIQEVSPKWEGITSIQFEAEVIDCGVNEYGLICKEQGVHHYVTLISYGEMYRQTFKRKASGEWERV
jgi:hypothetical protein